ncbi:PP2C family protein-serine/threonine phosphatase [Turneriella parva]|uniref:Stage II sporulation protein E n=1 Tax=Turneriella parva (strain ATCC BAA-1111 / DSM 21527 / NCTC 11395 / H) TaxID=869212 RepID=I4B0R5_TURPD|nr:PP2C family protein-serine/threonine phosphatase [Turneriella parva]AFM10872.1 Stage II sporulation protein E [Turneriella parva DSM 21527]
MMSRLRNLFRKNPDRIQYRQEFVADMDRQLNGFVRIGSAIAIFAWLDFAFNTDKKLHPEFPELLYFRLGLTGIAILVFLATFIPQLSRFGALSIKLLIGYVIVATSFFTGRIADDPNYVSGLQIVVMIPIATPVAFRLFLALETISILTFVISVLVHKPNLSTPAAAYSMNNLLISYVIAISFSFMLDRIRFGSFMKTKKIELKNIEIEAQIKRINELKTQQDGDYFLTSQLLHPLALNEAVPSRIRVEFLTEQKKKFQFRQWHSEIGGDISSSNSVILRNKRYVAFMNGDAMGKSIQGAGGALVLGTVFKSFLHRTQNDEMSRFVFPEQWLRDCYEELDHVMISFDGRMLVSAVIGLIDEDSGLLYYINAEHPWIVVLRNGEASFIEEEMTLRKLGMPENEELFRVKTYRLQQGDVIFAGSDGRDDISMGRDEMGNSMINSDETLFLRTIEKANGDLHEIRRQLQERGDITDDLSLIRITYDGTGHEPITKSDLSVIRRYAQNKDYEGAAQELDKLYAENPHDPKIVYELALLNSRLKHFAKAAALGEEYCNYDPSDLGMIYLTSRALKYCANGDKSLLKRAADYGERLILREPMSFHGIVNLSDIYRRLEKKDKAALLFKKAQAFDPENRAVKRLEGLLTGS